MNGIALEKQNMITDMINAFCTKTTQDCGVSREELIILLEQYISKESHNKSPEKETVNETPPSNDPPMCIEVNNETSVDSSPSGSESSSTVATGCGCPYIFSKGKNKGQTCNKKAAKGQTYCSRHNKYEGSVQKTTKKTLPMAKKTEKKDNTTKTKKVSKILRKNHVINHLWHEHTRLVFKSAKERVVIGICKDDEIHPLTEEDILVCKEYSFAYVQEKVEAKEEKVEAEALRRSLWDRGERQEWDNEYNWNPKTMALYDKEDNLVGEVTDVEYAELEFFDDEEVEVKKKEFEAKEKKVETKKKKTETKKVEENNLAFSLADGETSSEAHYTEAVRKITSVDDVSNILSEIQLEDEEQLEEEE